MKLKQYISESSCPITNKLYGGIGSGGGYGSSTEYEIGAQKIAEALHCILGSLGRDVGSGVGKGEKGHIMEEYGIILKSLKEYGKSLYSDRVSREYYAKSGAKWPDETVATIEKVSPVLAKNARKFKKQIGKELSPASQRLGGAAYDMLAELADAMYDSVSEYPNYVTNAFRDADLNRSFRKLTAAKNNWLQEF